MGHVPDLVVQNAAQQGGRLEVARLGEDGVVLKLPRGLSILSPVFTLAYGGKTITATKNVIEGDSIVLDFRGLANFEAADAKMGDLVLTVGSVFGEKKLRWTPGEGMAWRFAGVE